MLRRRASRVRYRASSTTICAAARLQQSSIFPRRIALLDERADAFLGVARHHVFGHHLGGVAIGLGERQFELAIERGLANANDVRGLGAQALRGLAGTGALV